MGSAECWVAFKLTIDAQNDWVWAKVNVESKRKSVEKVFFYHSDVLPSSVEHLWYQATVS